MRQTMKINIVLGLIFLSFLLYANSNYLHGIVGLTMRDGGTGCVCHNFSLDDSVNVWIEGPDSIQKNITAQFKLFMTGGPAVEGGFNIASNIGLLSPVDTLVTLIAGELTHSAPNPFKNDTVSWSFYYTAPDSIMTDTLYSVGNSVNGDGNPNSFDKWNFGKNFIIYIIDSPVNVDEHNIKPEQYTLYQNYPNPFNPSTTIRYTILLDTKGEMQEVSLKVYDVLGNEVATLVDEYKLAGDYEVIFDAADLSSGIYYYRLQAGEFVSVKKMILMK